MDHLRQWVVFFPLIPHPALIDHEWKPLVPPYDYLKFMADEEHSVGHGRRWLRSHHDDDLALSDERGGRVSREERYQGQDGGRMPGDKEPVSRGPMDAEGHSHQHVEL